MKFALFAMDSNEARVIKRVSAFADNDVDVIGFMFHRKHAAVKRDVEWDNVDLGQTYDGRLGHRLGAMLRASISIIRHRRALVGVTRFYAINTDNALLALLARAVIRSRAPLAFEVADVQPAMLGGGIVARLLRFAERCVLRYCDVLVTTSPGFVRHYFEPVQRWQGPVFLLENKVYPAGVISELPSQRPVGPPWVVGYFGVLRCDESWRMIRDLVHASGGRIRAEIYGYPSFCTLETFLAQMRECSGINYGGPYVYPTDLPVMHERVHFSWAFDFSDEAGNSRWLLPNRLYESGRHGVPLLGAVDTEAGAWILRNEAGAVFGKNDTAGLIEYLNGLTWREWQRLQSSLLARPENAFSGEKDHARLVATLIRAEG